MTCPGNFAIIRNAHYAPVAQWIEHRPPEPGAEVRFLSGVPLKIKAYHINGTPFLFLCIPVSRQISQLVIVIRCGLQFRTGGFQNCGTAAPQHRNMYSFLCLYKNPSVKSWDVEKFLHRLPYESSLAHVIKRTWLFLSKVISSTCLLVVATNR